MRKIPVFLGVCLFFLTAAGCECLEKEENSEEVVFEIVEEDEIPEKMKTIIEEEKEEPFQITYEEDGRIYIGQGYGQKEMEGYEIEVDDCRISEHFLYVHTILTGPDREPEEKTRSWPYIVIRVEQSGKQVIFLN